MKSGKIAWRAFQVFMFLLMVYIAFLGFWQWTQPVPLGAKIYSSLVCGFCLYLIGNDLTLKTPE